MRPLESAPALQWWQDWPGWALTTFLAAIAAAVVVWQLVRYYKDRPQVEWSIDRGKVGRGFHVVLWNVGDAAAIQPKVIPEPPALRLTGGTYGKHRVDPGQNIEFMLDFSDSTTQDDINAARVRVEYLTSPVNRRQRRAFVVQLVNGEHWTEKMKP